MDAELDVLQHLAMAGIAETPELIEATPHGADTVQETLATLEADGAVEDEGFWYLTEAGEDRLETACRDRFDDDQLAELRAIYDDFEAMDVRMKACAEAWQDLDEGERAPDTEPVADLRTLHEEVTALFDDLDPETKAAYDGYLQRLDDALDHLGAGDLDYVTGTEVDSYHTVWFELHDDLLRTLGEERS